jgi:serine/threonine protein kinase
LGLIHRDIKPANILFADAETAKLVDFGLAMVMSEAAQARGEIWGTPYYIAPEKLDEQPEDFRSDIYSLGGTLFHALAGRPPYEAESASLVALKQLKSRSVSLQAFAPDVCNETAYVINRMMAKKPEKRYASYNELVEHLQFALEKAREREANPEEARKILVLEEKSAPIWISLLLPGLILLGILAMAALYFFTDVFKNLGE